MAGVVIAGYIIGHILERFTSINAMVGMTIVGAVYRHFGFSNFLNSPVADIIDATLR
jgi:hypothetical protein